MNAYSILHNYDQPLYSPDFNFINAALSYKQEKYDANKAKINSMYEQFNSLRVRKDVDQNYIESRLQQVRQIASKYEILDLSDDNLTSSLLTNASQILDDKVKTAIVSTRRIEAEDAEWEEKRKKADGKYNQTYHEYVLAMSDRQRYLQSEEAGDSYGGGAEFIADSKTEEKVSELAMKAAEKLKQKAFENRASGGAFSYQDTYEFSDKNSLRSIIESSLDENDKRHFKIMSWKKFQGAENEEVFNMYKQYNEPRIEKSSERLDYLKVLQAKAEGDQLDQINKEIENETERLKSYTERGEDDNIQNRGRDNVAFEMYYDDYMNGLTEPYAAKRLIDRDIDEVQKANIEFAETVRQHNFQNNLALKKDARDAEKHALDMMKLEKELGIGQPPEQTRFVTETDIPDDEEYDKNAKVSSGLAQEQKEAFSAIEGMKGLLGRGVGPGDYKEVQKVLSKLPSMADGESITLLGKKVKLNAESRITLLKFKNTVLEIPPARKEYRKEIDGSIYDIIWNLGKTLHNNDEFRVNNRKINVPNFGFELVERNGSLVSKETSQGKNNFEYLLKKVGKDGMDSLSAQQQATLKAYTSMYVIMDPDLDINGAQKREHYYTMRDNLSRAGMDMKEFSKLGTYEDIAGVSKRSKVVIAPFGTGNKSVGTSMSGTAITANTKWFADKLNTIFPGGVPNDSKTVAEINNLGQMYRKIQNVEGQEKESIRKNIVATEQRLKSKGNLIKGEPSYSNYNLSDISTRDLTYQNKKGQTIRFERDLQDIVKNSLLAAEDQDKKLQRNQDFKTYSKMNLTEKDPNYKVLRDYTSVSGLVEQNYKGPIGFSFVPKGQGESEMVKITTYKKVTKDNVTTQVPYDVKVKKSDFEKNTGIKLNDAVRTDYSYKFGTSAAKLDIGNGVTTKPIETTNFPAIAQEALSQSTPENFEKVKASLNDYMKGKYRFKAEIKEDGLPYFISVYKNGKFIKQVAMLGEEAGIEEISYEDAAVILQNAPEYASEAFRSYLKSTYNY